VEELAGQLARRRWRRYRLLEGRRGPIVADIVVVRAVASRNGYREGVPGPEVWVLIRRPVPRPGQTKAPELKYYLSNASADTPVMELLRVGAMRWPIESCFEEGKGELGLDHYELRFWRGWYHHMTLVILAHHFLVRLHQRLMARTPVPAPLPRGSSRQGEERGACAPRPSRDRATEVCPFGVPWPPLAVLPLSLRTVRFLLQVALPQPVLDVPAALAWLAYRVDRRHREVARDNLRHAFPYQYDDAELDELVRAVYRHPFFDARLFGEFALGYSWPRTDPAVERKGSFGVGVNVQLPFGPRPDRGPE
jgi:hypothetical protein